MAKASSTTSLTGDGADDHMRRMWSRLDVDNSGFLDMDEIKELLSVVRVTVVVARRDLSCARSRGRKALPFRQQIAICKQVTL